MHAPIEDGGLLQCAEETSGELSDGGGTGLRGIASCTKRTRLVAGGLMLAGAVLGAVAISRGLAPGSVSYRGAPHPGPEASAPGGHGPDAVAAEEIRSPCPDGCPDRPTVKCVIADENHAQCVDCDPDGNWKYECVGYFPNLQKAAVRACAMPCGDLEPPEDAAPVEQACQSGPMKPDYGKDHCIKQEDGSLMVACNEQWVTECGAQFSADRSTGAGRYSIAMQPARGNGIMTQLFLYSFGQAKDRKQPWNEVSFDVLGMQCSPNETLISTNFFAGDFDASARYWEREPQHQKYISVPFDACADWHTYTIEVDKGNITWWVDEDGYRSEDITEYSDLVDTIASDGFQARLLMAGQEKDKGSWEEQGFLDETKDTFPLYSWFANMEIPESGKK